MATKDLEQAAAVAAAVREAVAFKETELCNRFEQQQLKHQLQSSPSLLYSSRTSSLTSTSHLSTPAPAVLRSPKIRFQSVLEQACAQQPLKVGTLDQLSTMLDRLQEQQEHTNGTNLASK